MLSNLLTRLFALLSLLCLCSCSTILSKDDKVTVSQWGHPYSGVYSNLHTWPCFGQRVTGGGQFGSFVAIFGAPLLVIDFGLSAITDTVLLPFDLSIEPEQPQRASVDCSKDK